HSCIERPIDGRDQEVDDARLRTQGLENLRVPLLTGLARTVTLGEGEEEAVCIDVVFSPSVLAVALHGETGHEGPQMQAPELTKFVRMRLVELALKNAEDDLGYRLGRDYTLPRGVPYRGGVGGGKQPVPMPNLRKMMAAVEHAQRRKQESVAPGPWRSKRSAAGLANNAKIEEIADVSDGKAEAPLIKKGFLNRKPFLWTVAARAALSWTYCGRKRSPAFRGAAYG
ncbi:MAG: hypothetical protein CMK79_00395, partial [Pseudomonadales bacterium]|nr:hypothetical protein [Pseudomonadales bacterium]